MQRLNHMSAAYNRLYLVLWLKMRKVNLKSVKLDYDYNYDLWIRNYIVKFI